MRASMSIIRMICILSVTLMPTLAGAWTETYSWGAVIGATSYTVEKSVDAGTTWTLEAAPTEPSLTYTGTEPGLTIFRVSACNANGCTLRTADGLWHNEAWALPLAPGNLQVQ